MLFFAVRLENTRMSETKTFWPKFFDIIALTTHYYEESVVFLERYRNLASIGKFSIFSRSIFKKYILTTFRYLFKILALLFRREKKRRKLTKQAQTENINHYVTLILLTKINVCIFRTRSGFCYATFIRLKQYKNRVVFSKM